MNDNKVTLLKNVLLIGFVFLVIGFFIFALIRIAIIDYNISAFCKSKEYTYGKSMMGDRGVCINTNNFDNTTGKYESHYFIYSKELKK